MIHQILPYETAAVGNPLGNRCWFFDISSNLGVSIA